MKLRRESCILKEDCLLLFDESNFSLVVHTITLNLISYDHYPIECSLNFYVSSDLYEKIDDKALFNLRPHQQNTLSDQAFLPNLDFEIEVMLKPNLFHLVQSKFARIDELSNHIYQLGKSQTNHPLLLTENWLCLSVQQPDAPGKPGYRTFWADLSPAAILEAGTSSEEISAKIINFFQAWAEADLVESTQQTPLNTLEEMVGVLKELADFGNALVNPSSKISTQKDQAPDADLQSPIRNQRILEEVIHFFTEDDWSFTKIQGQSALQIGCQGNNGEWNCYAKAHEDEQQFVFYSICPISAPEDKRPAIAEFLTRANYGMTIGNFELDYTDGEIRYKTSIDVEGDRLTSALIKTLVYTNVSMMDEYLPGIRAVLEHDVSPSDAIAAIEQPGSNTTLDALVE